MHTVYEKLCVDLSRIAREDRLSIKYIPSNDKPCATTGKFSTTLVYGDYLRLHGARDRDTLIQRAAMIRDCTATITRVKVQRPGSAKVRDIPRYTETEKVRTLSSDHSVGLENRKLTRKSSYRSLTTGKLR